MAQRTTSPRPRYRVVCYELHEDRQQPIMDETGDGFVAAIGAIAGSQLQAELASAGPHELQAHLALAIANDEQLNR